MRRPRLLVLDNRDSFTFNIVQALAAAGAATGVVDAARLEGDAISRLRIDGLVLSPGPGLPADARVSVGAIHEWAGRIPVWGVCLGHQCLALARGARCGPAREIRHGKTSTVRHEGLGLFEGLPSELEVMRYHSLAVIEDTLPADLVVTARSEEGEIMGLLDLQTGAEGVQFHPESVMGEDVRPMLAAFVRRCAARIPDPALGEPT